MWHNVSMSLPWQIALETKPEQDKKWQCCEKADPSPAEVSERLWDFQAVDPPPCEQAFIKLSKNIGRCLISTVKRKVHGFYIFCCFSFCLSYTKFQVLGIFTSGRSLNISANGGVYLSQLLGKQKLGFSSNCKKSQTQKVRKNYSKCQLRG